MLERVYLHIGPPKTGSTALQDALFHSVDLLRDASVYVPFQNNMTCILQPVREGRIQSNDTQEFERLLDVLENNGRSKHLDQTFEKVVLSCEFLSGLNAGALEEIKSLLHGEGREVFPIMYLRNPVSLYKSRVQELLKKGISYKQATSNVGHRNKALFERLNSVFPDTVIVRQFPSGGSGWDILEDFESVCCLPKLVQPKKNNTSMSLQAAIMLDELSGDNIAPSKRRDIVRQVLTIPGDRFTLGRDEYQKRLDELTEDAEWANQTFDTSFDVQRVTDISWEEERARVIMRPDLSTFLKMIRASIQ
jgi:hypothetical protein